jgi:hypothetical protein
MQKVFIGFIMCVRLSVSVCPSIHLYIHMEHLGFSWNFTCEYFSKTAKKIQVALKSYNNNGNLAWRYSYIYDKYLAQFFWE